MPMEWDHFDFRISESYLPSLINGDDTGLDDAESAEFDAWRSDTVRQCARPGWNIGHWSDVDGSGEDWGRCEVSGLFAMRCTVRLHIYRGAA
jgi:hypothetical protein